MKKIILMFFAALLIVSLNFTGCSFDNGEKKQLDYDSLLQMPKTYVGIADKVEYESFAQYKEEVFSKKLNQGALVTIECIDTAFYITVRHSDGDIMISGKAISKCKVSSVGDTFNGFDLEKDSLVELEQDYYLMPTTEQDALAMFESFGAVFLRDSDGAVTGMELSDGDYLLTIQNGVEYTLKLYEDALPMESGKLYTGALVSRDSKQTVQYLSPLEDTDRYNAFRMSQSTLTVAGEIKAALSN